MRLTRYEVISLCFVFTVATTGLLLSAPGFRVAGALAVTVYLTIVGLGAALPVLGTFGPVLCRMPATDKVVAITFDDGPDPQSTPALLDLLRKRGVPAVFFCVGRKVEENPSIVAQIVKDGHMVGNHSYGHSNFTNLFGSRRLKNDLQRTQDAVEKASGIRPVYLRSPMGLTNPIVFRVARQMGLHLVGWTVRGLDTRNRPPERIVARLTAGLKPGAIMLLHDGGIPTATLTKTVEMLIDEIREKGYRIVLPATEREKQ